MSTPVSPDDIDALAVARRVAANPKTFRLSTFESIAMAECLIALDDWIERLQNGPTTNATLAASVAAFIKADAEMNAARDEKNYVPLALFAARTGAFNTLQTTFEKEFPNVSN